MKVNVRSNKGASGIDITTGIVIFVLFSTVILSLYLQIYKQASLIKIHEDAMGYLVEICETIDLREYDLADDITSIASNAGLPTDRYSISYSIERYSDSHANTEDLVKRITITLSYTFDNEIRTIEINKIKVKE